MYRKKRYTCIATVPLLRGHTFRKNIARSAIVATCLPFLAASFSPPPPPTITTSYLVGRRKHTTTSSCNILSSSNTRDYVRHLSKTRTAVVPIFTRTFSSSSNQEEQDMTKDAMLIIGAAIQAVDPYAAVRSNLIRVDDTLKIGRNKKDTNLQINLLDDIDEIIIVAFGKASSSMATAVVQQIFHTSITNDHSNSNSNSNNNNNNNNQNVPCRGVVICKDGHITPYEKGILNDHKIDIYEASHPVPDARSCYAADKLLQMVSSGASDRTLVLCCISGGGSSLFCRPIPPLTLENLQHVNSVLLASGMGIEEMNILRKRLEQGKAGRLAAACFPSRVVSLILSDILRDPLDLIASGPTVPDPSTYNDAWRILQQYNLKDKLPKSVVDILKQGKDGHIEDSPRVDHPVFATTNNILIGNNALAVEAASKTSKSLGYNPVILGTEIEGEAKEIAHVYVTMASYLQKTLLQNSHHPHTITQSLPSAIISGGETTVTLSSNSGKGGRNQELALSAALLMDSQGLRNIVLASVGTDGGDGPTDAAGAIVDGTTVVRTRERARIALVNHDAYPYFDSLCAAGEYPPLIKTGPTGTNVADICVTLVR